MLFKTGPLGGRYLREIVSRSAKRAAKRNVYLEPRVSIYARSADEWAELAAWFDRAGRDVLHPNLLWAVQCPRVYHVWRKAGMMGSFGDLLRNFFGPLFDATLRPDEHPQLAALLEHIRCIDTVDNEALQDRYDVSDLPPPDEYTATANPPYAYYHMYFWANVRALNQLRLARGKNEIRLRPHAGEAGPLHHLATAFLFAHGISHGILLKAQPTLQYLYYVNQIGISVSPISNACLFVPYVKNPFPAFYKRGLRVTLTTDDPLQFHVTEQPQLEEYVVCSQHPPSSPRLPPLASCPCSPCGTPPP
jgi:AMP deaminase